MNSHQSIHPIGVRPHELLQNAGIFCLPVADPDDDDAAGAALDLLEKDIAYSQQRGFGFAWVSEHHNSAYGGTIPDPLTLIAALGTRLKGIRLGTAVLLAPLRHPVLIAEQARLASRLIDRPVELGLGRGFLPGDQGAFGLTPEQSSASFWQAVEALAADRSRVPPSSVWVATTHPAGAQTVGRLGLGLALNPYTRTAEETDLCISAYLEARAAAGHAEPPRVLIHEPLLLAKTAAEAREQGRRHFTTYLGHLKDAQSRPGTGSSEPRHTIGEADYAARCPFDDEAGFRDHVLDCMRRGVTHWCFQTRFGDMPDEVTRATLDRCATVLSAIGAHSR